MLIYVLNLKKKMWLLAFTLVILAILIIVLSLGDKVVGVFSQNREIPIYSVESIEKKVAITFDCAWGADDIPVILDTLKKEEIKATFFIVGQWAEKFPDKVKSISLEGHDIANHSYSHLRMGNLNQTRLVYEISEANKRLSNISGKEVNLFRAPYGEYDNNLLNTAKDLGLTTIQWNVDSLDWKVGISQTEIINRISQNTTPGSILLFHNDTVHTSKILPSIIKNLKDNGYTFLPVSQMILKDNYTIDFEGKQRRKK